MAPLALSNRVVGYGITGSFCTLDRGLNGMKAVIDAGAKVVPIMSGSVSTEITRFGDPQTWRDRIKEITGRDPLCSLADVEPIGPKQLLDVLIIAPCTGTTMAKIAHGISDTPVAMAAKAQLRNLRPVVLSISTNDGLGLNMQNVAKLLCIKDIYFVPFGQDNPEQKPNSLDARIDLLIPAVEHALMGRQVQPVLACGRES